MSPPRVACVTGAGNGIGRAVSVSLARSGWQVACLDLDAASAAETVALVQRDGGAAVAVRCDVSSADDVRAAAETVRGSLGGPVGCLVNNAGVFAAETPLALDVAFAERMLRVNVLGPYLCTLSFLGQLESAAPAHVVCVSSGIADLVAAADPIAADKPLYAATKAALDRWTLGLAPALAHRRIAANVLYPGALVDTPGLRAMTHATEEIERRLAASSQVSAFVDPATVAEAVAWICEQPATFTGNRLRGVDFGRTWAV